MFLTCPVSTCGILGVMLLLAFSKQFFLGAPSRFLMGGKMIPPDRGPPAPWLEGQLLLLLPPLPPPLLNGESTCTALSYYPLQPVIMVRASRRHSTGMVGAGAALPNLTSDLTPCRELPGRLSPASTHTTLPPYPSTPRHYILRRWG